jgi:glycosyltransferase involved in cell wall biosynthesis
MSFQKVYECLAGGRPVIYGCCNDKNPVNDSGAGICVEPDNAVELARAIEYLSGQSLEQLWQYGQLGRRRIEQNYSIPSLVDRLETIAYEVTGQPRPAAHAVTH